MQTTILKPNKRQEPGEVNGQNQSQVKTKTKSQKPWAISQVKPSEANWSQVKPSEAKTKSQVGTQMGDLAPKCMQNADFSSRMQQIARTASPGFRMKNKKKQYHP